MTVNGEDGETLQLGSGEFITQENETLLIAGTKAAESAFGIGCWLGALISLVLVAILFAFGVRNPIILSLVLVGSMMLMLGISSLFSSRAKDATIMSVYQRNVVPKIDEYLQTQHISRSEFHEVIKATLDTSAPLSSHFSNSEFPDSASFKESER